MPFKTYRFATALIIWLFIATGAFAQTSNVVETKLDNGMMVLMKEVHAAPVFTAQLWFKVGSKNEHTGITGISHLLEHMLFKSSKNYKEGEISRLVRERGGIDNAATWTDFTYYWVLMSNEHLDFAMKVLAERLGNSLITDEEFAKERTVVLSELRGRENDPGSLLYYDMNAAAFKAHPYRWPVIGWQSDVENVTAAQLREYYHTYYHPNNATLILVGDFDRENALELIRKYFDDKPKQELPREPYTVEPAQRGRRDVTVRREGSAERVMLAYHIPEMTHPDTYPLMVLDQILSGGRSSRLYQALVETQLATGAWSSAGSRKDPSLMTLGAVGMQGIKADKLESALLEQVEKVKTALASEDEMTAAKNQLEAYFIFQNDSVSDQGEQLGYYNTLATWNYIEELIPNIKNVTAEQVRDAAKKYLTEENLTAARFLPTNDGSGNGTSTPPGGPVHFEEYGAKRYDACYYRNPLENAVGANSSQTPKGGNNNLVKPTSVTLENGLTVIVQENHANPTVAVAGNLKAGSYFDPEGKSGTASLTADMLRRGTRTRSALEIAKTIESVGASVGISADVESVDFNAKSLKRDFSMIMELLSDQLRKPVFPPEQFDRAKSTNMSELEQSRESPQSEAFRGFYNSVFPAGHPYHVLKVEDAQKELSAITREDLAAFHKAYYRPDTATIVIVGDVDATAAVEEVRKRFGDWKAEGRAPEMNIATIATQKEPKKIVVNMPDKSEIGLVYGYAMGLKRSDPDYYAVRVMNQILGGSGALASILGEEIREKRGLVYSVYSTYEATLGAGPWYAMLGTAPKDVDKAVDTLRQAIADFKSKGATQEQFARARDFIIGVFPIALETNEGVARALLSAHFYGLGMDYLRNYADIYRGVTLELVNAAAKKYLHPENGTLVIAGPYEKQ